ncbi:hypothetical protein ABNB59_22095 [Paenibacillus larvae]|uniref:Uncharacterized protein n=4 Tax=Paenibacillus larvae TaxID=1464 RepID=A0A1U9YRJ8_9BACL|nr:hypothetical protein [Paenibacillus larvae]AQR77873.1 hypothetical protein BXP28_11500 [Paenibacillus larvae subsp. larvae]AQT86416.1 hypothetical protein B1222_21700 [Paenibacillus larvae subsp. pulvifaciens]AQZ48073.1 hypothetical protein B5S25_17305 [Paenibacillus larvae subsp. pulvifaciens]ARF66843.1 hypothetical protein B7C51_01960 [Paenibacillus larvae subsp. pulvifaciens]AVF21013.1 toxin-like protein [Paenibacillus larvae subsp. larvae]
MFDENNHGRNLKNQLEAFLELLNKGEKLGYLKGSKVVGTDFGYEFIREERNKTAYIGPIWYTVESTSDPTLHLSNKNRKLTIERIKNKQSTGYFQTILKIKYDVKIYSIVDSWPIFRMHHQGMS